MAVQYIQSGQQLPCGRLWHRFPRGITSQVSTSSMFASKALSNKILSILIRKPLNEAVVRLKEKGEIAKLESKWWGERSQCRLYDIKVRPHLRSELRPDTRNLCSQSLLTLMT